MAQEKKQIMSDDIKDVLEPKKVEEKIPEPVEETVTLKKSELDGIMERLNRVEAAADKARIANYDNKNKSESGKIIKLRSMDGKIVISWENMTSNLVEKNSQNGAWREDQKVKINYFDGSSEEMELVIFNRRFQYVKANVIKESINDAGTTAETTIYFVKTEDGHEYSIDKKFIN
jgi:hypothetical protein